MAQYLNKSAVVAMIKHHINEEPHSYFCKCLLSEIDTLEVKEVDSTDAFIEKVCEWLSKNSPNYINYFMYDFGKFVEDFRKAQKGEEHDRD